MLTSYRQIQASAGDPAALRELVRKTKADGADLIKLFATTGLGAGGGQTMTDEQLQAACGEAKSIGLRTLVHAIGNAGALAAVKAGCNAIEHGTFLEDATLDLMRERGTYFDPNLLVLHNYLDNRASFTFTPEALQTLEKGLAPTAPADKRRLIRRAYFDLIGLPPTPEEVEAFVHDSDPMAYERVIDHMQGMVRIEQDRLFIKVTAGLVEETAHSSAFHSVDAPLHDPLPGYKIVLSFKTFDRYGNLQLTFQRKGDTGADYAADVDIDDAQGVEHIFQVLRNSVHGPTNPYDIHDILLQQKPAVDPGEKPVEDFSVIHLRGDRFDFR